MTQKKILKFIDGFKSARQLFLFGHCFWFAAILSIRFVGTIYYLPIMNHFVTKIGDDYYDASGVVVIPEEESVIKWAEIDEYDSIEAERIRKDCILMED